MSALMYPPPFVEKSKRHLHLPLFDESRIPSSFERIEFAPCKGREKLGEESQNTHAP